MQDQAFQMAQQTPAFQHERAPSYTKHPMAKGKIPSPGPAPRLFWNHLEDLYAHLTGKRLAASCWLLLFFCQS